MSIPAGITREDVLAALVDLDGGIEHSFGESTKYDLVYEGQRYPPKAVVGLAARRVFGRVLEDTKFNGGDTTGSANPYLRNLGFVIVAKETEEVDGVSTSEQHIASTIDTLVEEWQGYSTGDEYASPEAWSGNRRAVVDAISRLNADSDLRRFADALGALPGNPPWFKKGAHRTFLGALVNRAPEPEASRIVADAYTVPETEDEARLKILALEELAEATERMSPGPKFAPLAASGMWSLQDPMAWPWLSATTESALQVLRLLASYVDSDERYMRYRELMLIPHASPPETVFGLSYMTDHGSRSLSPGLYDRMKENSDVLVAWSGDRSHSSEADRERAGRNIHAALGEMDLLARGLKDDISALLVRDLVTSKTDPRIGYDDHLPFRADAYAIFAIEKNMSMPSIRVWATPSGLAIGAHFGSGLKYAVYAKMADQIQQIGLPTDAQFFDVCQHSDGDRLRPAGREAPRGELFVGEWFPGGLAGPDVGAQFLKTVAKLQAIFDAMAVRSGASPTGAELRNDPLYTSVEEFREQTGYPTDADLNQMAERGLMAEAISVDGLANFDFPEFRRIFNTARYAHPGPQSHLNTSLNEMTPEELDGFAEDLEYLLRGDDLLPDRTNALMDQSQRGVRGLGESVITKLLAIEYPSEIVPVCIYSGAKGKAHMLRLLDLDVEGLDDLDVGTRLVRSNQILRERLLPFFGSDTYGMSTFLYWYMEHAESKSESADEIDRIGNLADKVFVDREDLEEIVDLIQDKGQVIFYGPPGTGKTYLARELAKALSPDPSHRILIQFHPSTSYEDFFEGYRPGTNSHEQLVYRLVKGPLALLADRARENPSKQFVMVIDEINRANLPKVFGELLFLLEYREEAIRSLYRPDEPFDLPKNLWFIGTMNTADRSISLVDAAMRRRFHFVGFFPDQGLMKDLLSRWLLANGEPDWVAELLGMVNEELRERLGGPHLQIGPSHFMRAGLTNDVVEQVWTYSVFPYIEEQLYGDESAISEFRFKNVLKRCASLENPVDETGEADDDNPAPGME